LGLAAASSGSSAAFVLGLIGFVLFLLLSGELIHQLSAHNVHVVMRIEVGPLEPVDVRPVHLLRRCNLAGYFLLFIFSFIFIYSSYLVIYLFQIQNHGTLVVKEGEGCFIRMYHLF
jgi:hypothetical protein